MKPANSKPKTIAMEPMDKTKIAALISLLFGFLFILGSLYYSDNINDAEDRVNDALRSNARHIDSLRVVQRDNQRYRDSLTSLRNVDKQEEIQLINTQKQLIYENTNNQNRINTLPIDGVAVELRGAVNRVYCCP